jgi:hypothetical protein
MARTPVVQRGGERRAGLRAPDPSLRFRLALARRRTRA